MPSLPTSLALTSIADGALIVAADHRNNYTAIQTAVNSLITTLGAGATGQFLTGNGTTLSWLQPPANEYVYAEITASVNVVATTEATATTVVTAASVTVDGATPIIVEFSSPYVTKGTTFTRLYLYDGASSIGFIGHIDAAGGAPFRVARRLTPSAAVHTYSIRGSVDAGTGVVQAGVGGVGAYMPAFIRILKV